MDVITLATTAYTLAKPFLKKTGEGITRKVGEDIWSLIKKPFIKNGQEDLEAIAIADEQAFTKELTEQLNGDADLATQLEKLIAKSQMLLTGNFQQNINSYDKVEKQINIQSNSGNIQM